VLGLASNTFWRWQRAGGRRREAYEAFWQDAVRYLAGRRETGRVLAVEWDRQAYRPGESADVALRVAGRYTPGSLRVEGVSTSPDGVRRLHVEESTVRSGAFHCRLVFETRAPHQVQFKVFADSKLLETYEREILVGPQVGEGAHIAVDPTFLAQLAARTGGQYAAEGDWRNLAAALANRAGRETVQRETPLVEAAGVYLALLLTLLVTEWTIRRRMHLV